MAILAVTTFPHHFVLPAGASGANWGWILVKWGKSGMQDELLNALLFLPLGFGLGGWLRRRMQLPWMIGFMVTLGFSLGLSYLIETLQIFIPPRFPALQDVFSNTFGGALGWLLFCLWETRDVRVAYFTYALVVFVLAALLQRDTTLRNWDSQFFLLLGNEGSANRPWQGEVSEIFITSRAMTDREVARLCAGETPPESFKSSLLALYRFKTRERRYKDLTGHLPDLVGEECIIPTLGETGVLLGPHCWLKSERSARVLVESLKQTSGFTLSVSMAPGDLSQDGPARIASLSVDAGRRNFTLGQVGPDLVFRLRTPLTGENGSHPSFVAGGVLNSHKPLNATITYDGRLLIFYIDGVRRFPSFNLNVGAAALSHFVVPNPNRTRWYQAVTYGVIFLPLGFLASLFPDDLKRRSASLGKGKLLITGGLLLPPLTLKGMLACVVETAVPWLDVGIAFGFIGIPLCLRLAYRAVRKR